MGSQHRAQKDCCLGVLPFTKMNFMCRLPRRPARHADKCSMRRGALMAYLLVLKSRLYHRPNKLSRGAYRTDLSSKPPSASSKHCVQTLAAGSQSVARRATRRRSRRSILVATFSVAWPRRCRGIPLNSSAACRTIHAGERRGQCRDRNEDLSIS
jgi:hypothetical protein